MNNEQQRNLHTATIHKFLTVYRYMRRQGRQMHKEGISGRKIAMLRYLLEAGPQTIGQLRDYLYIGDSSTSELVAWLQKAGYVTRVRSAADNRVVIVTLTPAGRAVVENIPLGGVPLLRERLKTLSPERLSTIHEAMTQIIQLLELDDDH